MRKEMEDKAKLFEAGSPCNALANAIVSAAEADNFMDDKVYEFLETTARTSMVVFICDALEEMGYTIQKIKNV